MVLRLCHYLVRPGGTVVHPVNNPCVVIVTISLPNKTQSTGLIHKHLNCTAGLT